MTKPIKILFLIDGLRLGGKERRILELLKGLKAYKALTSKDGALSKTMRSAKQKVRNKAVLEHVT